MRWHILCEDTHLTVPFVISLGIRYLNERLHYIYFIPVEQLNLWSWSFFVG